MNFIKDRVKGAGDNRSESLTCWFMFLSTAKAARL